MNWTENIAQMNRSALLSSLSPVFQLPRSCHMDLTVKACMPACTFFKCLKKKRLVAGSIPVKFVKVLSHAHLISFVVTSK